jgi:hypothetical protein
MVLFLASVLPDGGAVLRSQLEHARVLSEGACCASVVIVPDQENSPAVATQEATAIEALSTADPHESVRLVITRSGLISHLELVHPEGTIASQEFPAPSELGQPEARPW